MRRNQISLISAIVILSPLAVQCQSLFELCNLHTPVVDAPVFDAEGNPLEGPGYLAELYGGSTLDSLAPAVDYGTPNRVMAQFFTGEQGAGYFGTFIVAVMDIPWPQYGWLQVRAWDARLGATYEDVAALQIGGYGESPAFYAQGNDPEDQFGFAAPLIGLQSFSLRPIVPEPTIGGLLALGGALLRWARCRKVRM